MDSTGLDKTMSKDQLILAYLYINLLVRFFFSFLIFNETIMYIILTYLRHIRVIVKAFSYINSLSCLLTWATRRMRHVSRIHLSGANEITPLIYKAWVTQSWDFYVDFCLLLFAIWSFSFFFFVITLSVCLSTYEF